MAKRIPTRLSARDGRRFGLTVGVAFLALGGVAWWRGHHAAAYVGLGLGTLLVLAGLVVPGRLGPVHRAWMGASLALSKVTTPVFMGAIYFFVFTPVGILMRLLRRTPLARDLRRTTFWFSREGGPSSDMERQF